MISVVIPAYEARAELPMCLASILAQTLEDWECIVVDDGSTDRLDDLIEAARDPRVRVVRHETNRGRGAARATGLGEARGELIAWQDADDWSFPDRLERQLTALQAEPDAKFVGSAVAVADGSDRCVGLRCDLEPGARVLSPLEPPPVAHPTLLFRAEVLEHLTVESHYRTSEDHAFLSEALQRFPFTNVPEPLYCYREIQSQSARKYVDSTWTRLQVVAGQAGDHPMLASQKAAGYLARCATYLAMSAIGLEEVLVKRRSRVPANHVVASHTRARETVTRMAHERFGALASQRTVDPARIDEART